MNNRELAKLIVQEISDGWGEAEDARTAKQIRDILDTALEGGERDV